MRDILFTHPHKLHQLNSHSASWFHEAILPAEANRLADGLEIHYTPKHGSWLNMVEIEFIALAQ
jgi:hypothetical protein